MITPRNIIDITYLHFVLQNRAEGKIYKPFAVEFLREQQNSYLETLKPLLLKQLEKYLNKHRIDSDFRLPIKSDSVRVLMMQMAKTYRSDMKRRNDVWNEFAKYLTQLEETKILESNLDNVAFLFDRIHNSMHNTETNILGKLLNGSELIDALNFCFNATANQLRYKSSSRIKKDIILERANSSTFLMILESRFGTWEYSIPKDKEQLLWDFYTMTNIDKIAIGFPGLGRKSIEIQNEDLISAYQDAREKLHNELKPELLKSVLFAVAAEFRHLSQRNSSKDILILVGKTKDKNKNVKFIKEYLKRYILKTTSAVDIADILTPRDEEIEIPVDYEHSQKERKASFESIKYALAKSKMSVYEFMQLTEYLFENANWASSFGGKKWANIAKGWQLLYNARSVGDIEVYIDHVYDLQHNTDTVFNKLKSYYKSGYGWIKSALDKKLNLKNIYELIDKASPELKRFAYAYVHDLFGISKEMLDKKIKKEKASDKGSSVYKVLDTAISTSDFDYSKMPNKKNEKATQELIDAAKTGNLAKVKQALLDGADPKAMDSHALRWAAYYGHADCVRLLIPVSDPKAMDSWALRSAAYYGHADCVRLLIPVSDPKAMNSHALRVAADNGYADCVRLLIPVSDPKIVKELEPVIKKLGIDIEKTMGKKNEKATQELIDAAKTGNLAKVKQALLDGADPKAVDSRALRWAANYGHAECVKLLIPVSDPKAVDSQALRWAAHNGHADCVRLLIPVSDPKVVNELKDNIKELGIDIEKTMGKKNEKATQELIDAAKTGNLAKVKQALLDGADPKAVDSEALRFAAEHGHADCVKLLIPVSDPKAVDSQALRWAASKGHAECVKMLIPVSDPKAINSLALRWAAKNGHADCVRLLIPVSDPKAVDSQALRFAAINGHADCVKLLIPVSDSKVVNELKDNIKELGIEI